ncbi:TPA: glycosyltransferase [Citrobacter sedlakii]
MFLTTGLGVGGAERQICDLSDELAASGYSIIILYLTGEAVYRPADGKVKLIKINMEKSILGFLKGYFYTRKVIQRLKPDILHSHMVHANIFSRLIRLSTKIPILINTAHSKNEGNYARMLSYRMTDFLSDLVTNVSYEAVNEFILKKVTTKSKIRTVHNGINCQKFSFNSEYRIQKRYELNLNADTPLILSVGRLTEAKDYPNLLRAFSILNLPIKPHLAIIGAGEIEDQLKAYASELGCEDRVHWLGLRFDVEEWYSACDLFVLSSLWEGFGLVVAEAMSSECLVVCTNAGGVSEVINDDRFLVPVSDSESLAAKITEVFNLTTEEKQIIVKNHREHIVSNFSLQSICQKWRNIYETFLFSHKRIER